MRDYIEERAIQLAYYIIEHKATVRQTAKEFNVSKSTAHKDVTARLMEINPELPKKPAKYLMSINRSVIFAVEWQLKRNTCTHVPDKTATIKFI